jgi:hypothetical protein
MYINEYEYLCGLIDLDRLHRNQSKYVSALRREDKNYSFNSLAAPYDIDFDKIAEDLSKKDPVAVVTINEQVFILVKSTLWSKANSVNLEFPLRHKVINCYGPYMLVEGVEHSDIQRVISWAKKVRLARWPEGEKGVVTVAIPQI